MYVFMVFTILHAICHVESIVFFFPVIEEAEPAVHVLYSLFCTVFEKGLACHLGTMSRSSGARVLPRLRIFPRSFLIEKISQFGKAHAGYAYPALVACAACAPSSAGSCHWQ